MYARINIPAPWGCPYHPDIQGIESQSSLLARILQKTKTASGERYTHRERGLLQLATQFVQNPTLVAHTKGRLTAVLVEGGYVSFALRFL